MTFSVKSKVPEQFLINFLEACKKHANTNELHQKSKFFQNFLQMSQNGKINQKLPFSYFACTFVWMFPTFLKILFDAFCYFGFCVFCYFLIFWNKTEIAISCGIILWQSSDCTSRQTNQWARLKLAKSSAWTCSTTKHPTKRAEVPLTILMRKNPHCALPLVCILR